MSLVEANAFVVQGQRQQQEVDYQAVFILQFYQQAFQRRVKCFTFLPKTRGKQTRMWHAFLLACNLNTRVSPAQRPDSASMVSISS